MHADDTNCAVVKNGVVVVSGTGPAIRVDGNRLVIRDGPQETKPLVLTREEASRRLRHIIVCGHAGGFITFDALRWLRDTGVAFSQLDWGGTIIIASGPQGSDRPSLRRAQALVCSGVIPKTTVAITREILRVKLEGQAAVAAVIGSADASKAISKLSARIMRETNGGQVLSVEASAASAYWSAWRSVPIRFARRNPQRLGPNGQWRPGRLALDAIEAARPHVDYWLLTYLASSAFANRDFTELPDGEIRLSHPLTSHLAHTAPLWRMVCEPIASWLAQGIGRGASAG
jgi:CRISPR/Cas system-associated endonuclease Cas1